MAGASASAVAGPLRMLWDVGVLVGFSDGQLLDRFTTSPSDSAELAFQMLVERHGPMVLGSLPSGARRSERRRGRVPATFLVLFRRAGSIRDRASLASWLYGVAARLARRANVEAARRRRIEAKSIRPVLGSDNGADRQEVTSLVHEELALLPQKYRAPIVLCTSRVSPTKQRRISLAGQSARSTAVCRGGASSYQRG